MKNLRERSGGIEDFDHKLDDKLIAFEDSGHDKKHSLVSIIMYPWGQLPTGQKGSGWYQLSNIEEMFQMRDPDERHIWVNI
ncbi:MAG: hypothetical protein QW431_07195 [Conexivisphaerales archaeon]